MPRVRMRTRAHKRQYSLFKRKKEERKKNPQYFTDSRAGVRFRFNVRLHVDGGGFGVGGGELGLVWKGVGLAGVPHGSRPFCTNTPADVTHTTPR